MSAGAYTSVPDVIDYLVATFTTAVASITPKVQVCDGWPGTYLAQQMVVVGGGPDLQEQSSVRDFAVMGLGPNNLEESYEVPVYVRAVGGGTAVKPYRDQAFAIYKACEAAIRADMTLGGAVQPYPAHIAAMEVLPVPLQGVNKGRAVEIRFTVAVRHRY